MSVPARNDFTEVQAAIRDLIERLQKLELQDIDLKGKRIRNAGNALEGGDYVTLRQLEGPELEPIVARWLVEGGEGEAGNKIYVNCKEVEDPNFNDNTPATPDADHYLVKWQHAAAATCQNAIDDVSAYVAKREDLLYPGSMIGVDVGGSPTSQLYNPFDSGVATGMLQYASAVMPINGYLRHLASYVENAQTQGVICIVRTGRDQFQQNLALSIYPGAPAGVLDDFNNAILIEQGEPWGWDVSQYGSGGQGPNTIIAEFATVDGSAIIGGSLNNASLAATVTNYAGIGFNELEPNEVDAEIYIPFACRFRNGFLRTEHSGTQSATGSLVYTLRKNKASQALVITRPAGGGGGVYSDVTNTVDFAAGDLACTMITNNASVVSRPLGFYVYNVVDLSGSTSQILAARAYTVAVGAYTGRYTLFANTFNSNTAEQHKIVATRAGRLRNLAVRGDGASGGVWTITAWVNDVATTLSVRIDSGDLSVANQWVTNTGDTVNVERGDTIYFEAVHAGGTGAGDPLRQMSVEFAPKA